MKSSSVQPPTIAVRLIDLFVPETQNESVKGDLLEEFSDIATNFGEVAARSWYWKHSMKTIAHLMFRTPWVIATALLSIVFVNLNVTTVFMTAKFPQFVTSGDPAFASWLWVALGMFGLLTPSWVLAMIAKGKELIATSLLAFMFVFSTLGVQVGASMLHLIPSPSLPPFSFFALQAFLIVLVGIAVQQVRLISSRSRARG
jgi:hypothetical protein